MTMRQSSTLSLASPPPVPSLPRSDAKGWRPTRKKKVLTPEERVVRLLKRKNRQHEQEARDEVAAAPASTIAATVNREAKAAKTSGLIAAATKETLLMPELNPSQHRLVVDVVAAAITGSSLQLSPCMSTTPKAHGFQRHHPQTPRLCNSTVSGSPEVSVVAPATRAPAGIDLNAMRVGCGSSSGHACKRPREL
ncbi:hypothetical protein D1007_49723 [Hordeum vulgare]|nr:hypothetical protein D1007_49723 [Hordeum vulgare]